LSRTLLISDLHLAPERPQVTHALAAFLSRESCDALYILGDLFETWVGDDDDSALARDVAAMLRAFSERGAALYIMHGNRDFLIGQQFCAAVGATLLPDPSVHSLNGQQTLLMHGDSLCTADEAYQAFRRQARDPAWQAALLEQSLEERRALAERLREVSQEANSNKAEDIMDVTLSEVEAALGRYGVKRLIHGHTHRPAIHNSPAGERWVLGDWEEKGWYIQLQGDSEELLSFDIQ
jgi:UDP-2,3-diacylglucosamine hydrolase